ncbi:hypothetical protein W97_08028 [Coniosporium apollinis CBS 100218]|uniref:NAD(P)-binding protein n=1 Tax=Coniosporium apollinis (strain CBS 100218) TaxID=1168221 RepID=R7Z3J7_CONA1|nr:uncharacterized protein W97_08028 [Coniosporium apollinis CBS 100218]EON68770.1 hypothetical protein W97_08028 [Coniosporium apollinis CBS 100218]
MPATSRPWALVSPASRGIGLQLARRILQTTNVPVVATARKELDRTKGEILNGLKVDESRLDVLKVDMLDETTIESAASHCASKFPTKGDGAHHLHLAYIIPGLLFPEKSPRQIDASSALLTFQTNALGPLLMLKHFSPFLPKKNASFAEEDDAMKGLPKQAIMGLMSARVGSITDNTLGGWYSYRASKAAVNQITKTFDNFLRSTAGDAAMAVALHPGTVKTELSREFWGNVREEKLFEAEWVAERLVERLRRVLGVGERGRCWDWKGEEIPP